MEQQDGYVIAHRDEMRSDRLGADDERRGADELGPTVAAEGS